MGLKKWSSSWSNNNWSNDRINSVVKTIGSWLPFKSDGNPDKYKFSIKRRFDFGNVVAVEINYPDCKNHNGNKILVYEDKEILEKGIKKKCLDPHFLKIGNSPVARFEPTETGWIYAISFAKMISGKGK